MNGGEGQALELFDAGLNVFPLRPGSKEPYWKGQRGGVHGMLTTTRLHRSLLAGLVEDSNLAVMCGRLSHNLFVLDCDSHTDFEKTGQQLQARGLYPWIRNGTDGGQYWLRCAEGEVQNRTFKEKALEILGNHKYTVAPPSVHPDGMIYEWVEKPGTLPPRVSVADIDFLPLPLQLASTVRREARSEKKHALPPVANAVLIERHVSGYATHSEAEYAAVLSLLSVGKTDETICELFRQFHPPHYAKKSAQHFQRYTLDKAHEYLNQQEKPQTQAIASPFAQWAMQRQWEGRTGNTDRAVFLALCERYQRDRTMPFRASMRELAELANLSKEAVHCSLHRLQESKVVICAGNDRIAGSNQ